MSDNGQTSLAANLLIQESFVLRHALLRQLLQILQNKWQNFSTNKRTSEGENLFFVVENVHSRFASLINESFRIFCHPRQQCNAAPKGDRTFVADALLNEWSPNEMNDLQQLVLMRAQNI